MSCPICGRILCDHTPEERGQTPQELDQDLLEEGEQIRKRGQGKEDLGEPDMCLNCGGIGRCYCEKNQK